MYEFYQDSDTVLFINSVAEASTKKWVENHNAFMGDNTAGGGIQCALDLKG